MKTISLTTSQLRLAWLWFSSAGITAVLLIILTALRDGADTEPGFRWFSNTFLPTCGLIAGILVNVMRREKPLERRIGKPYYQIVLAISIGYILAAVAVFPLFALASLEPENEINPARTPFVDTLNRSSLWLSIFQALVVATIGGVFFVPKDVSPKEQDEGSSSADN